MPPGRDPGRQAQPRLQATYQIPGGAGQRGQRPLPFRGVSIIHNIKVALPDHHLQRRAHRIRGDTSSLHEKMGPQATPIALGCRQDSDPHLTPQLNLGT